ncbi:hypothetical protein OUZ56_002146 [Daphnia magna]|uniref:Uncharacterized protein n=1 Tax=Daphnia magna TaxID=35525 RepID=A0ABR0A4U1_9CRUS|nr:hypothetical protein OUZ56_002146 [Daphnia magna]
MHGSEFFRVGGLQYARCMEYAAATATTDQNTSVIANQLPLLDQLSMSSITIICVLLRDSASYVKAVAGPFLLLMPVFVRFNFLYGGRWNAVKSIKVAARRGFFFIVHVDVEDSGKPNGMQCSGFRTLKPSV